MATFLNHVTIAAPRNATTTHTVTPSSGAVVAGSLFTPTAGNLLVCGVEGAVTSSTPAGWTLPTNGSAVNNSGLYVWYRTAAGNDSLSTTHNASNYPVVFDFYEFAAGSTFVKAASSTSIALSGTGPSLTGLTGTNWTAGSVAWDNTGTGTGSTSWTTGTKVVDTSIPQSGTDGYLYSLAYIDDDAATSRSYTETVTLVTGASTGEALAIAVAVAAGGATAPNPRPTTVYRNAVHRSSNY